MSGSHFLFASPTINAIIDSSSALCMPQLVVRQIEENVVKKLKERAGQHGVSMEEEHRRILRDALLGNRTKRASFKDALLAMPNVGADTDFERGSQMPRNVEL